MNDPSPPARVVKLATDDPECRWVECKSNGPGGGETLGAFLGKYASALSNGAALARVPFGYLVFGVDNQRQVVGTNFDHQGAIGNQPLEFWLTRRITPGSVRISFQECSYEGTKIVVMAVSAATGVQTRFERQAYVRIGSATPRLADHPSEEADLTHILHGQVAEDVHVLRGGTDTDVLELINAEAALGCFGIRLPGSDADTLERLRRSNLITSFDGGWNIPVSSAILFARRLGDFSDSLLRKGPRIVVYDGTSRTKSKLGEREGEMGYAIGFPNLAAWLESVLPLSEHLRDATRVEVPVFPPLALRELIANALIHQDLSIRGAGPMIEVFDDRVEITSPGPPLVSVDRLLDEAPVSRNERMATMMRKMGFCEERGSGIDKVVELAEVFQLPAPDFRQTGRSFSVTLYAPRSFSEMSGSERVRAAYQHASLVFVSGGKPITNRSLRARFGLRDNQAAQVSRILAEAVSSGLIQPANPEGRSKASAAYVPFWVN